MQRILIVDDEEYIVQGLVGLIQRAEDLELEVYKATSAEQALDWLGRTKIDIVLSDISMPGMDGIALQKEIMALWPNCRVIFLTGFSDFSYVKEALRHQAVDYILKAEGDEVILGAVRRAADLLNREFERAGLLERAEEQLEKAVPALQKELLTDVLLGELREPDDLKAQFGELRIPLSPEQPVLLIVGKADEWPIGDGVSNRALLLQAVRQIAAELLGSSARLVSFPYERGKLVWFLQPLPGEDDGIQQEPREEQRLVRFAEGTLESVQENVRQHFGLRMSFALAKRAVPWSEAAGKFGRLQQLLGSGAYLGQEALLTEDVSPLEPDADRRRSGVVRAVRRAGQLEEHLENGRKTEFVANLEALASEAEAQTPTTRMIAYHRLAALFMAHMAKIGAYPAIEAKLDLSKLGGYEAHGSWEAAVAYFRELAELNFEFGLSDARRHQHRLVQRVHQFIGDNLAGDLSLTRIGEWLSMNPYYLSRLFKQLTGDNLTETIVACRLDRAKQMLLDTNLKVIEIAARVGFESNAYFHRFFKKSTGLTPQEFRESAKSDK
ncbi:two-component system, response regulator YesN [Cohnella sp. OV330]|uniref:response regulator n=1 Tax=Cohnella sp. OV330 TaxID=1855288 RepID=UPI0008EA3F64|nr:response regulator [Cohnella sp. OV330]SFB39079.1 two-component system, response regulator YesN [Cohnella sp. OV330]